MPHDAKPHERLEQVPAPNPPRSQPGTSEVLPVYPTGDEKPGTGTIPVPDPDPDGGSRDPA